MTYKKSKNILIISDTQFPFEHQDALAFCKAVQEKFKCGRVVHIGDISDQYHFSMYAKSPDALSANEEISTLQATVQDWAEAFPRMDITIGNHDKRIIRRLRDAGVPSTLFTDTEVLNRALGLRKSSGWKWHKQITLEHNFGKVLIMHGDQRGITQRAGGNISTTGMSTITGHRHSTAHISYRSTSDELKYDMVVGCLIDDEKLPFDYNKGDVKRPIISVGVIVDGYPQLIVMRLDEEGKMDRKDLGDTYETATKTRWVFSGPPYNSGKLPPPPRRADIGSPEWERQQKPPTRVETTGQALDGGGERADDGKPRVDLVPPELTIAAARALGFGANKYGIGNWERGIPWMKVYACLLRHVFKWAWNKKVDDETGLSHMDHIAANVAMLAAYEARKGYEKFDDRRRT